MLYETFVEIRNADEPIRTLLIGSFLFHYGTALIFPTIIIWGYIVRVLRNMSDEQEEIIPDFTDWKQLFFDGLYAYLIWLTFCIIPLINYLLLEENRVESGTIMLAFFLLLTGGGILSIIVPFGGDALGYFSSDIAAQSTREIATSASFISSFDYLLHSIREQPDTYLLLLLVWYVVPVAIYSYSQTGRLRSGFKFDKLRKYLLNTHYFSAWIVFFSIWVLSYGLMMIPSTNVLNHFNNWMLQRSLSGLGNLLVELSIISLNSLSFCLLLVSYAYIGMKLTAIDSEVPVHD